MLPEPFEWIYIPAGIVEIDRRGNFEVMQFWIAKYPITVAQYSIFIEDNGYETQAFWTQAGWEWKQTNNIQLPLQSDNYYFKADHPISEVSWYKAVAFCRWLSQKTAYSLTLPTEQQWQHAKQGDDGRAYPWGNDFNTHYCNNSVKEKSSGTTPVTAYPEGASPYEVLDMSGNVWEWMLNEYGDISEIDMNNREWRSCTRWFMAQ